MSKKDKGRVIADKKQDEIYYNKPEIRQKEFSAIRIYQDENIEHILREIQNMKQDIIKMKQQISAHDYNIVKWFKRLVK